MDIIELFIDEENEVSGIDAISVVENPAIEEDFIALKNQEFKLAEVDKEKRILWGRH
jgi:sporulation-control protein spo0M